MLESRIVVTYGLSTEENERIERELPGKDYRLIDTQEPIDLIAMGSSMCVIVAGALDADSRDILVDYYTQLDGSFSETVFWIGELPPKQLQSCFHCVDSVSAFLENAKYLMLNAHRKARKMAQFSTSLCYGLRILCAIRSKPGITTKQLAQLCEISPRSVLRYIETLRCCGEGIEYDVGKKGWKLFHGISFLLGEHMKEEWDQ